jgi:hypothetical protein
MGIASQLKNQRSFLLLSGPYTSVNEYRFSVSSGRVIVPDPSV